MAETRIDELRRRLERDPGSRLFAQLAEELRKSGDLAEAIRVARAGLVVNPAYPSARLTLGRALLDSGDATGGRAELESALRDAPDNIQASRYLGQAREQLGDLKGAAEQYRKTLAMAPEDRQLQGALAALEARLPASAVAVAVAAAATTVTLPLPAATQLGTPRAGAPPVVFAPSRAAAAPEPEPSIDFSTDGEALPPTVRIRASQAPAAPARRAEPPPAPAPATPAPPAPAAPTPPVPAVILAAPPPPPAPPPAAAGPPAAAESPAPTESVESQGLPTEPASASTTPFSSSTLAELYFQQGLVERAVDVYRQLVEQEPGNEKARQRLAEIERPAPVADDRSARRRALERTIAGLEALLGAVRAR